LGISLVAFRDEHVLAVGLASAKAGHAAIDEFHADQHEAAGFQIGEIAAHQADVFAHDRTEAAVRQAHMVQHGSLDAESARRPAFHPDPLDQAIDNGNVVRSK